MSTKTFDCRICGVEGLTNRHGGTVDCIYYLRWFIGELYKRIDEERARLPKGEEQMRVSLSRETTAYLWIDGPLSYTVIDRLIRFTEFLRDVYEHDEADTEPSGARPVESADTVGEADQHQPA